jgi:hypothetical protein
MEQASAAFDDLCSERHETGAQEYGPFKFLENDTLEMLEEELADIANYARYTFIKVQMLRESLAKHAEGAPKLGKLDDRDQALEHLE